MYVCMYVCMYTMYVYVCMYVCMCVYMYVWGGGQVGYAKVLIAKNMCTYRCAVYMHSCA